jgi:anthraniloyl-CoA monooxygenase
VKILVLGGGPAGLYSALLIKKNRPDYSITVLERNPADVTYGWGVVFSDRTLASFQQADYKTYQQISDNFVIWDAIDVRYRGETIRCGGHVIAAISRARLLNILQNRCAELGVEMHFGEEITDLSQLPKHDLLIAADGINSMVRSVYEGELKPTIELGKAKYIWLGANKVLDAFNFIFHQNEYGLFQVHAYPFSGTTSTFIVECDEATWLNAGLDKADEAQSLAYCQRLLDEDLGSAPLLSNNSRWINFPTLLTRHWHITPSGRQSKIQSLPSSEAKGPRSKIVLLGDAVHTAHFSIGSGTKLAMEDAIALANALEQYPKLDTALNEYELERKPVVETFQRAAHESQTYFETIKRYLGLEPMQFAFQLLTRSGRITYDDLHFRDARFGDAVDRWFAQRTEDEGRKTEDVAFGTPPMFAPFRLRELTLENRVVSALSDCSNPSSVVGGRSSIPIGPSLFLTPICAVSPDGRITPDDPTIYEPDDAGKWSGVVEAIHSAGAKAAIQLGHAGRRGATRPKSEGLDRPLREGGWPLVAASSIPYTPRSQVPKEMDRADMDRVRDDFVWAAQLANEGGFDLLQLHFAQGYLLATFLSPLTNVRTDEYGGDLQGRMRFPLAVFDAVRAVWPSGKPISAAISASDCVTKSKDDVADAVVFASVLKEHGCDLVEVLAGQTTPDSEPVYGRGFLTHYSDRIRNEAGIATLVGGYLTTSNEVNTILAAGRADLCIMELMRDKER